MGDDKSFTLGSLPWSFEALEKAYFSDFQATWTAIHEHPGYNLYQAISSLRIAFRIFDQAVEDFLSAIYEFHHQAHFGDLFDRRSQGRFDDLLTKVRMSVFTASQSAMALVDHTRRLSKKIEIPGYTARVEIDFANNSNHRFIQDLRNCLTHVTLVEPHWQLTNSLERGRETHFILKPDELLQFDDWHSLAISYIRENPDGINLKDFLLAYRKKVREFHEWFSNLFYQENESSISDYLRYERHIRAISSRSHWNLILNRVVIQAGRDPYDYLLRYLTDDELKRVYTLPMRSKAQVDLIITLLDSDGACNEDLRQVVYKAFGVSDP